MTSFHQGPASESQYKLQQGKYVFTGQLKAQQQEGLSVPFLTAKAIAVIKTDDEIKGDIATFRVSDLILKNSGFINENGKIIEAHKLFTWPRNLGSTDEWTAAKQSFIEEFVLNFPIEVISLQEGGVTWKFITPEEFKKIPEEIVSTARFSEYMDEQDQYIFLRRPLDEPR